VAVLDKGVLQQLDTPRALYRRPANLFVAGFIGSPAMNFFECPLVVKDELLSFFVDGQQVVLGPTSNALTGYAGRTVIAGIRPEHFSVVPEGSQPGFRARVTLVEELGASLLVYLSTRESGDIVIPAAEDGRTVRGNFEVLASLDGETRIAGGEAVTLGVASERIHFFDPATGQTIHPPLG
ncbi:MAG: TOBE domain-containing protein, partial [Methylobacteriaceae bacterium]|nr:TOBE domain-containing protein [Methylobacteriaceae bacterium]